MLPASDVNVAVQSREYSPPLTAMGEAVLMPVIVTPFEVTGADNATPVCAANVNASGVESLFEELLLPPPSQAASNEPVIATMAMAIDRCMRIIFRPGRSGTQDSIGLTAPIA